MFSLKTLCIALALTADNGFDTTKKSVTTCNAFNVNINTHHDDFAKEIDKMFAADRARTEARWNDLFKDSHKLINEPSYNFGPLIASQIDPNFNCDLTKANRQYYCGSFIESNHFYKQKADCSYKLYCKEAETITNTKYQSA